MPGREVTPVARFRGRRPGQAQPFRPDADLLRAAVEFLGVGGVEDVGGADEVGHERAAGALVDLVRRADLFQAPVVEDADPVAHGQGLLLVMGDEDEGDAERALQFLEFHLHLLPELQVQGAQRLVQQQDLRLHHQRPGQRHALALAAGQLGGLASDELPQLHAFQGFAGPLVALLPGHAAHAQAVGDVVDEGHVREQRIVLEHGVEVALEGRHPGDVLALEFDASGGGQLEACDQAQDRGFAGSRRPQHGEEFTLADVQVHGVDGDGVSEDLGEFPQADRRNRVRLRLPAGGERFGHGVRLTPLPDRLRCDTAGCDPGHNRLLGQILLLHRFCV